MSKAGGQSYYEILGVHRDASEKEIRKAYLKASLKYHPDKNLDDKEGVCKSRFIQIGEAYEVLSDPAKRAAYDRGSWTPCKDDSDQSFETYRNAFDAHVASMSPEDVQAAVGIACALGGLVGSIVGGRMAQPKNGGRASSLMSSAGSMMGSVVGSQMAGDFVKSLHEQSVERVTYQNDIRSSNKQQKDSYNNTSQNKSSKPDWKDIIGSVASSFSSQNNSKSNNNDATQNNGKRSSQSSTTKNTNEGWANAFRSAAETAHKTYRESQNKNNNGYDTHKTTKKN
jgi:DnaJ-class molecular chaperone